MADVVSPFRIFQSQVDEPVEVSGMAPRFVEQFEQDDLRRAAGTLRRGFAVPDEALDDLFRGCNPAQTHARSDDFGEGIQAHDATVYVHTEQGRHERFDEFFMRGGRWYVGRVWTRVWLHLEEEVGFVFEDVDVVLLRHAVDFFSSLQRLRGTGRIMSGRDCVQ